MLKWNIITDFSDSMSVWNLLREFRIRKVHMAVVLNEYGGTVGVCAHHTECNHLRSLFDINMNINL